jgi:hypothetical protein
MGEFISLFYPGFQFRQCFEQCVAKFTLISFHVEYMHDSLRGQNCISEAFFVIWEFRFSQQCLSYFFLGLFFDPEYGGDMFLRNAR